MGLLDITTYFQISCKAWCRSSQSSPPVQAEISTFSASSTPSFTFAAAACISTCDNDINVDPMPFMEVFMPGSSHHFIHDFTPVDKPAEAVPAKEAACKADMPKPEQAAEAAAQQGLLKPAQAAESAPTDMPTATAAAVDEGHHMEPEEASPAESQVSSPVKASETPEPSIERPLVARSPCTPITRLCALYSDPDLLDVAPACPSSAAPVSSATSAPRQLYVDSPTACTPTQEAEEVPAQPVSPAPSSPASGPLTSPETPSSSAHADQAMSAAATAERHLDTAATLAVTSATCAPADVASPAPASSESSAAPPQACPAGAMDTCAAGPSSLPLKAAPAETAAAKGAPPSAPLLPQGMKAPPAPPAMPKKLPGAASKTAPKTPSMHQVATAKLFQNVHKTRMLPWEAMSVVPNGCRMRRPVDASIRTLPLDVTEAMSASLPLATPAQAKKQAGSLGKKAVVVYPILDTMQAMTNMSIKYKFLNVGGHGSPSALVKAAATARILSNANCAEQLEQLQQMVPDEDVLKKARAYKGDLKALVPAEQFVIEMASCQRLRAKVENQLFIGEFEVELTGTITSLACMASACAQLEACNFLDMVFSDIWNMGEHMNRGTTKANAAAFGVATLGLLKGMKAEKGATPGVGTALDFLAWMRVKTMDTESLAFCIQQGGIFCQYLSDLQAAVGNFQGELFTRLDKLQSGYDKIAAEVEACSKVSVALDCPAGLMLGTSGSEGAAAVAPEAKPARTPLRELTPNGADINCNSAPAVAQCPAPISKTDKENAPPMVRTAVACKAPAPPPRKAPPKAPPAPPRKAPPKAPPPPPGKAPASAPSVPKPPLPCKKGSGAPPPPPPPRKAGAKTGPKPAGGTLAEQLAAKNAAKAAALANAKVTMRITPPSEDDASFATNVSSFLEAARPKLDQVIQQKEFAKAAMTAAAMIFGVNAKTAEPSAIHRMWITVAEFAEDYDNAFIKVAKTLHPALAAMEATARAAPAAKATL